MVAQNHNDSASLETDINSVQSPHRFNEQELRGVYRAIESRRDIRHFIPREQAPDIPADLLQRLIQSAHHAPSVGFMQPWHFIRITDDSLRQRIYSLVEQERLNTADALNERKETFMKLKIEGIMDCSELLIVSLTNQREKYILGRRTIPEMDLASVACAIQNIWLAARAEGIGLGWVSFFEPEKLTQLINAPEGALPIAILCIGYVKEFADKPLLETAGWDSRRELSEILSENSW